MMFYEYKCIDMYINVFEHEPLMIYEKHKGSIDEKTLRLKEDQSLIEMRYKLNMTRDSFRAKSIVMCYGHVNIY